MTDIDFGPLITHIDEKFEELDARFVTKSEFKQMQTSIDNLAHQVLSFQQEMAIHTMRSARMESWIIQASQKIGVPYNT